MGRITRRDILAVIAIALVSGLLGTAPFLQSVHGLSLDILTALRWQLYGARHDPAASPSSSSPSTRKPFRDRLSSALPPSTWTREIGRVLTAILDGGAKVIGFDVIFESSIEQSEIPFGEELIGSRMRGFDRDYLRALATGAAAGKLVLGEIQQRDFPVVPYQGQRIAVRQQQNIRALNVHVDPDEVVRRLPLSFAFDTGRVPSMAVELVARAKSLKPEFAADGEMTLGGRRINGTVPGTLTLNFEGGADAVPTYSLADLRACVEKGDRDFFKRQFDGKIVLLGTLTNLDDRKLTSKRFATGIESARAPRCALPPIAVDRRAHPPHHRRRLRACDRDQQHHARRHAARAAPMAGCADRDRLCAPHSRRGADAAAARRSAAFAGLGALFTLVAVMLFARSIALPLIGPLIAGFVATIAMIGYRYMVANREERFLKASFALYLAPQVIEHMMASNKLPALGGEMRDVTVFFSDLARFSSTAEQLSPDALVQLMNEYLSAMTDIIEDCGGYVDKYIGDFIVAVFGAPVSDADHARNAVRTALRCRDRLEELNATATAFQGQRLSHRIGLNSGEALVGNIGSRRRFNYTVMSDAVNLASRLEGANKYFASSMLASETTVTLTGDQFVWRELDAVRVQGRAHPVRIYEPLAEKGRETESQTRIAAIYADGLARWRARDFQGAADAFAKIADEDPPAALFLARARELALALPGTTGKRSRRWKGNRPPP